MQLYFEYDANKNLENINRHGISLGQAQALWGSLHTITQVKTDKGENRRAIVGWIEKKIYMAIFTLRGNKIRLISCHRADLKWIRIYEKYIEK